jgi:hypothetical protein
VLGIEISPRDEVRSIRVVVRLAIVQIAAGLGLIIGLIRTLKRR